MQNDYRIKIKKDFTPEPENTHCILNAGAKILLLSLLVFIGLTLANTAYFQMQFYETGDYAANALQILKAKEFKETLGVYSRFEINHPGPILLYYLAFAEKILFFTQSAHGAHSIATLFYNVFFLMTALHLILKQTADRYAPYIMFVTLLIALGPIMPTAFLSVWSPAMVVMPTLVFLISLAIFINGSLKQIVWTAFTAAIFMQSQIVGISFVIPMLAISIYFFIKKLHIKGVWHQLNDKKNLTLVLIAFGLTLLLWIPPIIQQMIETPGNIKSVIGVGLKNATALKPSSVIPYVLSYYISPLMIIKDIPALVSVAILLFVPWNYKDRLCDFERSLYRIIVSSFAVTLIAAFKMRGGLIPHVYWFTYAQVALLYYLNVRVILYNKKFIFRKGSLFFIYFFLLFIFIIYGKDREFQYDDRPIKFFEALKPEHGKLYKIQWANDEKNFNQGGLAMGILLEMSRRGYSGCVTEQWHFLVRKWYRCSESTKAINVTLESESSDKQYTENEKIYRYRGSIMRELPAH